MSTVQLTTLSISNYFCKIRIFKFFTWKGSSVLEHIDYNHQGCQYQGWSPSPLVLDTSDTLPRFWIYTLLSFPVRVMNFVNMISHRLHMRKVFFLYEFSYYELSGHSDCTSFHICDTHMALDLYEAFYAELNYFQHGKSLNKYHNYIYGFSPVCILLWIVTCKRFLTSMNPIMCNQLAFSRKWFSTKCTWMFFSFVSRHFLPP